ncbi:hypothetical protein BKA62DRAFT_783359 [Auriculariales sp. MPI-PUGE-AT-0066]|nr:hypothetical protein BKA62DRAFT_783359 [Auriculariales sp. MPI-PUGE-AT-0066]
MQPQSSTNKSSIGHEQNHGSTSNPASQYASPSAITGCSASNQSGLTPPHYPATPLSEAHTAQMSHTQRHQYQYDQLQQQALLHGQQLAPCAHTAPQEQWTAAQSSFFPFSAIPQSVADPAVQHDSPYRYSYPPSASSASSSSSHPPAFPTHVPSYEFPHSQSQQLSHSHGIFTSSDHDVRSSTPAGHTPNAAAQFHHYQPQPQWASEALTLVGLRASPYARPQHLPRPGSYAERPASALGHAAAFSKHIEEARRTCETCGKTYSRRDVMLRHAAKAHLPSSTPPDEQKRASPKSIDSIVQQMSAAMDENLRTCEYCGKVYARRDGVLRHIQQSHSDQAGGRISGGVNF